MADNPPADRALKRPAAPGWSLRQSFRERRRSLIRLGLLVLGPVVVVGIALYVVITGARYVSTDNAYVEATITQISPEVSGRVVALEVAENEHVEAGRELIRIDDEPFRIALRQANAQLERVRSDIQALKGSYRSKQPEVTGAEAELAYARRELERQQQLARTRVASEARLDAAQHEVDTAQASLGRLRGELAQIVAQLDGDPDIAPDRHSRFLEAQAERDRAALDLRRTSVTAPAAGIISGADAMRPGTWVQSGRMALSLVADNQLWVDANFKETDLTWVRPGQPVTLSVDTYPDRQWEGAVESISPATGAEFSLLPPQNATGNWVKVVQRIPVRIAVRDPGGPQPLRAGMSTEVEIDTGRPFQLPHVIRSALAYVGGSRPQ